MVEYFNLGDVKHPVRITRRVLISIEKKSGKGLQALSALDTQTLTDLLYAGVVEGYAFTKEKNPFANQEAFENEVDDNMGIMEFYNSATEIVVSFFTVKEKVV
jgi:hypothetical protein